MDFSQLMRIRRNEKGDEYLHLAYQNLARGELQIGLSLLIAAVEQYGVSYSAVVVTLEDAIKKELLPTNFVIPNNLQEFKELYQKPSGEEYHG